MKLDATPGDTQMKEEPLFVTGLLLAAGRSSRMRGPNKLVHLLDGRPLVAHTEQILAAAPVDERLVILGHEAERVRAALTDAARCIVNPDYASGMTSSIQAGVRAASPRANGYLLLLGDMPFVQGATVAAVVRAFREEESRWPGSIVVPTHAGKRGHPVLFSRQYREGILRHTEPEGCRALLGKHAGRVVSVAVDDAGILRDLDTPDQFEGLSAS
jgi:molybdenum cofactor cytidylyltransferase